MSDNELDNLFKEAAEGFKIPEESSAWSEMAARLNDAGRTPSPSFWNWKSISARGSIYSTPSPSTNQIIRAAMAYRKTRLLMAIMWLIYLQERK